MSDLKNNDPWVKDFRKWAKNRYGKKWGSPIYNYSGHTSHIGHMATQYSLLSMTVIKKKYIGSPKVLLWPSHMVTFRSHIIQVLWNKRRNKDTTLATATGHILSMAYAKKHRRNKDSALATATGHIYLRLIQRNIGEIKILLWPRPQATFCPWIM